MINILSRRISIKTDDTPKTEHRKLSFMKSKSAPPAQVIYNICCPPKKKNTFLMLPNINFSCIVIVI